MKTITITIKIPKEIRLILTRFYSAKEIEKMLKDECLELLWDMFHAVNNKAKSENQTKKRVA